MENLKKLVSEDITQGLLKNQSLDDLFSVGLYHRFKRVNRFFLDELFDKNYSKSISFVSDHILQIVGDKFYVCLVDYSEIDLNFFNAETLSNIDANGIDIPKSRLFFSKYISEDDWYGQYLFYEESGTNIGKYVSGIINRVSRDKPSLIPEVYYLNFNLNTLINVYDDRGMDIMTIK